MLVLTLQECGQTCLGRKGPQVWQSGGWGHPLTSEPVLPRRADFLHLEMAWSSPHTPVIVPRPGTVCSRGLHPHYSATILQLGPVPQSSKPMLTVTMVRRLRLVTREGTTAEDPSREGVGAQ